MPCIPSLGGLTTSCVVCTGEAERCFFVGTLGGDGSSRDLRLFKGSGSVSRFLVGVGSEVDCLLLTGEPAVPGQDTLPVSGCEV